MTASLPADVRNVFERFITTEYTTFDADGQPITWPVTPYHAREAGTIDVTTGLGYPKKAKDARANPRVALLFSDPTGSELENAPMVLVQGTAVVDDHDLRANRERYGRESLDKLPATKAMMPPAFLARFFDWYYTRVYVHVRPERVYVWAGGDSAVEPQLFDAHLEEVRSGHDEEPEAPPPAPRGDQPTWGARIDELGDRYQHAVLSIAAPDGFPFSIRVPVEVDRAGGCIRLGADPVGAPLAAGLACLTAHDHAPDFSWQRNFQVRGDLVPDGDGWALVPHKLIGGFELPPASMLARYRLNFAKVRRFRAIAKRELRERAARQAG
ncbi:MAG TPA: pyridoxamine 5'-phosphate oxidase family protein [Solirubrobacteraceae bacterium]|nr:pyridoxamine 5'-phosphate oxidase family protein [Solirubrobacteraceae bacterium]